MIAARDRTHWGERFDPERLLRLERNLKLIHTVPASAPLLSNSATAPRVTARGIASSCHAIIKALVELAAIVFWAFFLCLCAASIGVVLAVIYLSLKS